MTDQTRALQVGSDAGSLDLVQQSMQFPAQNPFGNRLPAGNRRPGEDRVKLFLATFGILDAVVLVWRGSLCPFLYETRWQYQKINEPKRLHSLRSLEPDKEGEGPVVERKSREQQAKGEAGIATWSRKHDDESERREERGEEIKMRT
jgi:hypothetical protein